MGRRAAVRLCRRTRSRRPREEIAARPRDRWRVLRPAIAIVVAAFALHVLATVAQWSWLKYDEWRTGRAIVAAAQGAGIVDASTPEDRAARPGAARDRIAPSRCAVRARRRHAVACTRCTRARNAAGRRSQVGDLRGRRVDIRARGAGRTRIGGARSPPPGCRARAVAGEDECGPSDARFGGPMTSEVAASIMPRAWERASPRERVAITVAAVVVSGRAGLGVRAGSR